MASSSARALPIPLRLLLLASIPTSLLTAGTIGYRLTERWTWFESLYVAVITVTSMGYADKQPLSTSGRMVTIALAIGGISTLALAATELLRTIITGELHDFVGRRRMEKRIDALEQHVIVCGYGHVGQHVCADLFDGGVPVVVIDRRAEPLAAARDAGALALLGDATTDAVLGRAGIARARALVAVAGTDADNVLITMTARLLRPAVPIVSRAEDEATVGKLLRAGATRTVRPHAIAGRHIAQAVLLPAVIDAAWQMDEQIVRPGSPLDGATVGTSGLRSRRGRILVGIKHRDGHVIFNPADDTPVMAGDVLFTLGSGETLGSDDAGARP